MFAWIVFKSRADRDRVNAKAMKDPRLDDMMGAMPEQWPLTRMIYGGFNVVVEL